jgi:hypothetical protein
MRLFVQVILAALAVVVPGSSVACGAASLYADGFEEAIAAGAGGVDWSSPCIVDAGLPVSGIRQVRAADLDGDGRRDLILAQAFNVDRVSVYANLGQGLFAAPVAVETTLDDPIETAATDFNGDGKVDLAVLSQSNARLHLYANTGGGFAPAQVLDAARTLGTGLVSEDFDGDGRVDLVAIDQHAIDLYRNLPGGFLKQAILTTETAPDILECLDIQALDIDGDGDRDLVTGETRGGMLYRNDGGGQFAHAQFTAERRIMPVVHAFDADGNDWPDAVLQDSSGTVRLYRDFGEGQARNGELLFQAQAMRSIVSVDVNGDGWLDLYAAYDQSLFIALNNGGTGFAPPQRVYQAEGLFINEVGAADLDGDGVPELLWSAVNGRLGYFRLDDAR